MYYYMNIYEYDLLLVSKAHLKWSFRLNIRGTFWLVISAQVKCLHL